MDVTVVRDRAEELLRALAGADAVLRDDQWRAIEALVIDGRRVLCVQRTGWGKSAVYFIATGLLRARGAGPTVIVSPLIALMRNQIDAANRAGIHARTINSANLDDWDTITAEVHDGTVDVLLISPERLNNPDFRDNVLPKLAAAAGLLVVDEAHCISDWGHDFRPDYRRLRTLLAELNPGTAVLATTATANARVTADVADQLGDALVLRGPLDRASLRLSVVSLPTPGERLGWLADHLRQLTGSGIIYTLTVAAAEDTAAFLRSRGYVVASYTGQTEDAERQAAEADLLANRVKALVATSALGMGFDKPDLGFVVHLGAPPSPIAYYQQVGRAGRAVEHADVILLPGREDRTIWHYFASLAFPPADRSGRCGRARRGGPPDVHAGAGGTGRPPPVQAGADAQGPRCRRRGRRVAAAGVDRRAWTYDEERLARVAQARAAEAQLMIDYETTAQCGWSSSAGRSTIPRPNRAAAAITAAGRANGPRSRPRRSARRGRTSAGRASRSCPAASGRPRSRSRPERYPRTSSPRRAGDRRLSDLGWGDRLRQLQGPDVPVSPEVVAAVVEVLKDWASSWAARPVAVVSIGSHRHRQLIRSMATRVADIGRLAYLGEVDAGGTDSGRANSAHRVRALHDHIAVGAELASAVAATNGPILLIDDYVDSGWTMAIAARLLRQAGAAAVLPLALGLDG